MRHSSSLFGADDDFPMCPRSAAEHPQIDSDRLGVGLSGGCLGQRQTVSVRIQHFDVRTPLP